MRFTNRTMPLFLLALAMPGGRTGIAIAQEDRAAVDESVLASLTPDDDPDEPAKFVFSTTSIIGPYGYLVLEAAVDDGTPGIHTGFALNDRGEGLHLYGKLAPGAEEREVIDQVTFGLQLANTSIGRLADGGWGLTQPTFGSPNVAAALGDPSQLKLNEWMPVSDQLIDDDFV